MAHLRTRLALLLAVLAPLGLAACGGETVPADEVKAAPPELTIPGGADAAASVASPDATRSKSDDADSSASESSSSSDDADPDSSATGDATATPETSGAATSTPSSGGTGATGGGQAPEATATAAPEQDSAQDDSPPPAGSGAAEFEQFCQQNPGAC